MNGLRKKHWLKNKIFQQGIGIAEKSKEIRRDHWGCNVNHKYPYFDSLIRKHFNGLWFEHFKPP